MAKLSEKRRAERGFPNAEGVSEVFPQGAEDLARFSEGRRCLARFSERRGVQRGFPSGERRGARRVFLVKEQKNWRVFRRGDGLSEVSEPRNG